MSLFYAHLMCKPDEFEREDHTYITRTEKDEPQYTVEQELYMMEEQIEESEAYIYIHIHWWLLWHNHSVFLFHVVYENESWFIYLCDRGSISISHCFGAYSITARLISMQTISLRSQKQLGIYLGGCLRNHLMAILKWRVQNMNLSRLSKPIFMCVMGTRFSSRLRLWILLITNQNSSKLMSGTLHVIRLSMSFAGQSKWYFSFLSNSDVEIMRVVG